MAAAESYAVPPHRSPAAGDDPTPWITRRPQPCQRWRLYLTAAALGFHEGRQRIHQVLAVRPDGDGAAGVPLTRDDWYRLA